MCGVKAKVGFLHSNTELSKQKKRKAMFCNKRELEKCMQESGVVRKQNLSCQRNGENQLKIMIGWRNERTSGARAQGLPKNKGSNTMYFTHLAEKEWGVVLVDLSLVFPLVKC